MTGSNAQRSSRWIRKFTNAGLGIREGMRGQSSFAVHFGVAGAVVLAAAVMQAALLEWCILLLCISGVLIAELLNSALERMAKAITGEHNEHIGAALDMASGAVLLASAAAGIVGAIVFLHRLGVLLELWPPVLV